MLEWKTEEAVRQKADSEMLAVQGLVSPEKGRAAQAMACHQGLTLMWEQG